MYMGLCYLCYTIYECIFDEVVTKTSFHIVHKTQKVKQQKGGYIHD